MKRYMAVLLSVLLLMTMVLPVSAEWNYNDGQLNWGSDTCAHLDVTVIAATESTCVQAGHAAYTQCNDCGAIIYGSDAALPLAKHTYESSVTDPDCENDGYTTYTCANCGDSYVADKVDALGHNYVPLSAEPPTCEKDGFEKYHCTNCGDSYTETVPATGHDYKSVVTDPDCENDGYTTYTCANCGDSYVADKVDALGHKYTSAVTPPTCQEEGYTTHTCSRCGDSYVDGKVPATGVHTYDDDQDTDCNECGHVREVSVRGDVNGDGRVNNRDLGILQRYLNDWEITIDTMATDLSGDGKVNNRDLGLLQQYLNG